MDPSGFSSTCCLRYVHQKVFRKFQPQIVHIQDSAPLCQAVMRKAQRQGIPIVVTHHPGPEITAHTFFSSSLL